MSESSARRAVEQAIRNREQVGRRHADAVKKQAGLENEIGRLVERAAKTSSDGMRRNYLSQIRSKEGSLSRARTDVANRVADVAKADSKIAQAEKTLRTEEERERRRQEQKKRQEDQRQRSREQAQQREQQREDRERRQAERRRDLREAEQEHQITGLTHRTSELEKKLADANRRAAPPEVGVLLLASNPEDQVPLRLDKETREIEKRVRASDFRDSIYFRSRLARRLTDLMDDLNEERPAILHFSGHGNDAALAFEDEDGATASLDNKMLGQLLEATPTKIRLIVFNSCNSATQAKIAVEHVDIAIGMETAIDDEDAKVFAGQLYSSLGFGLSVGEAFRQARFQLEVDGSREGHEVPQILSAEGIDPETYVLINPSSEAEAA